MCTPTDPLAEEAAPNWTPEESGEKVDWEVRERKGKRASKNLFHRPIRGPALKLVRQLANFLKIMCSPIAKPKVKKRIVRWGSKRGLSSCSAGFDVYAR